MTASLYFSKHSFIYNEKDEIKDIAQKIRDLSDMISAARRYQKENLFYVHKEGLWNTFLYDKITVGDIFNPNNGVFGRDTRNLFLKIFNICTNSKVDSNIDLCDYLQLESETECNGIVVFNQQPDLPVTNQVFSTKQGWLNFRRYYLGLYPCNSSYFFQELQKYFENLVFHHDIVNTGLKDVYRTHSKKIVNCLASLNDYFIQEYRSYSGDAIAFVNQFYMRHKLDGSSYEGKKEKLFERDFEESICYCEPHLKINSDNEGNLKQYCRIYFAMPSKNDETIKIGYICVHL